MRRTKLKNWLGRLASATSRTTDETRLSLDVRVGRAMHLLYIGILSALLALFVPVFLQQFLKWNSFAPTVAITTDAWRVLHSGALNRHACGYDATADHDCPASPASRRLWKSPLSRADQEHARRVSSSGGGGYWIGAELPAQLLREARVRRANQLLLGWIHSDYRLWIDGKLLISGGQEASPLIIPISMERLSSRAPLKVAIEISNDSEIAQPDALNGMRGGEGFLTSEDAATFRDFITFWETVRPFSLLIAYTVIASLFFSFWVSSRLKSEYFFMALFALASAFYQARMTRVFVMSLSQSVTNDIDIVLRFYIASFGLGLGLAYARVRLAAFKWGLPICLGLPFLVLVCVPEAGLRQWVISAIQTWATPTFYACGALLCFLQAFHLRSTPELATPGRPRKLALFGSGLFALASFHVLQSNGLVPGMMRAMWMGLGFEHFVFVVFLGTITLSRDGKHTPKLVLVPGSKKSAA